MKVSGFTIVRNALKYDYPVVEAITSILPLCDEVVVAVGKSEDDTLQLIKNMASPKIRIMETVWDDGLREGGAVLAAETNKAFNAIGADADWCFYIQADEVIHEKYLPVIKAALLQWKDDQSVDGLLFNYLHFYGSYDYVGDFRRWYRKEIRVIRNNKQITSYRDAQGFRKKNEKLSVKAIPAFVYHYGWVKPPQLQQAKQQHFNKLWHSDEWVNQHIKPVEVFDYTQIESLELFNETHPQVMQKRIAAQNWQFSFDPTKKKFPVKARFLYWIEKKTGWRIGEYKNYKIS
jgi:glycosyltransferase involved in cell wall biosynthesis